MSKNDEKNGVIRLKKSVLKQLYDEKEFGETYNDVILRLLAHLNDDDTEVDDEEYDDDTEVDDEEYDDDTEVDDEEYDKQP